MASKKGMDHGICIGWHLNGNLKYQESNLSGMRYGCYKNYFENSCRHNIEQTKQSIGHGFLIKFYYEN
jgi:antitoxin component YwqK of YwqJK toxin-antitoxin module